MAWIIPAITAVGAIGSALASNQGQETTKSGLSQAELQAAQDNLQYQRALAAMSQKQATSGYTGALGSTLQYDPATNQWVQRLSPQEQSQAIASIAADIARNTTDARRQQQANEQELIRAAAARPGAEAARLRAEQFQPIEARDLAGMLQTQAVNASNDQQRAALQDILLQYTRSGANAAPIMAAMGKQNAGNLQDAIIKSRIAAMTGANDINAQRQQALNTNVAATGAQTTPNLSYAGITSSNPQATLAAMAAERAKTAAIAPAYMAGAANTAANQVQGAYGSTIGNVPNSNMLASTLGTVSNIAGGLAGNKDFMSIFNKKQPDVTNPGGGQTFG